MLGDAGREGEGDEAGVGEGEVDKGTVPMLGDAGREGEGDEAGIRRWGSDVAMLGEDCPLNGKNGAGGGEGGCALDQKPQRRASGRSEACMTLPTVVPAMKVTSAADRIRTTLRAAPLSLGAGVERLLASADSSTSSCCPLDMRMMLFTCFSTHPTLHDFTEYTRAPTRESKAPDTEAGSLASCSRRMPQRITAILVALLMTAKLVAETHFCNQRPAYEIPAPTTQLSRTRNLIRAVLVR